MNNRIVIPALGLALVTAFIFNYMAGKHNLKATINNQQVTCNSTYVQPQTFICHTDEVTK